MEKIRIMTVEDNDLFALLIDFTLKETLHIDVKNITSGEECLENLDFKPNIVILDYALPGINGLVVLKKIQEVLPDTKVIILSGQKDIQVAVDLINSGAIHYIEKNNNSMTKLLQYIRSYMQETPTLSYKI